MEKRVHLKVDADNLTLREVMDKLEEIQAENPDLDVFFDGDTKPYAAGLAPKLNNGVENAYRPYHLSALQFI